MPSASTPVPEPQWPPAPNPPELPDGRPQWRPATAVLAIIAGLGATLVAGLFVGLVGAIAGADLTDPPPSVTIVSTVVQDICFVGAAIFFARSHGPVRPWQFGLRPTHLWRALGWMAAAFVVLFVFGQGWAALVGIHGSEKLPSELGVRKSDIALAGSAILVTVIAPVGEEMLFRGYVFPALRNWRGMWPAAIITGLLFGGLHVLSTSVEYLLPLALFGTLLCLVYQRTGSLYPCIALHSINNAVAFGVSSDIGWSWQIVPVGLGALAVLSLGAMAIRRRFGPAPGLSPV